jgi:hypothetical protein
MTRRALAGWCLAAGGALLLPGCATTPTETRQESLAQLIEAYDVEGAAKRAATESLEEAHRTIERVRSTYGDALGRLSAEQRARYEAATDRFVQAAHTTADPAQATAAWAQAYAANLSDEDLRRAAQLSRTPSGQAQIQASLAAESQLRAYLAQQRSAGIERAAQQYQAEVRALLGVPR